MFVGEQNGKAEEAIRLYTSVFKNSKINHIQKYNDQPGEKKGAVQFASFSLNDQEFTAMDSGREHPFSFTPATSIMVVCESADEIDTLFRTLSEDGEVLMELGDYGFSKKYGWINDKFGVSWQLSLQ